MKQPDHIQLHLESKRTSDMPLDLGRASITVRTNNYKITCLEARTYSIAII